MLGLIFLTFYKPMV